VNKTTKYAKWINPGTGKRSDAAHAFVHPILDTQDNLNILLQSKVVRVLFDGVNAIGVEYVAKWIPD
jgi:alcohol oxidase